MSDDKHVLVLFYDSKDMVRSSGINKTLVEDVNEGFKGTGVRYTIRTASPRHEPWLALEYFNERKYDGIIVVAGMSCSLDVPHGLMDQLYDNQRISIKPRDWQGAEFERKATGKAQILKPGNEKLKYRVNIEDVIESKYHGQERPVPIIGVPTKDDITEGENALFSMLMLSRPSSGACVGIEQGYSAANLMSLLINTPWDEVRIIASNTTIVKPAPSSEDEKLSPVHRVARDMSRTINEAFDVFGDAKIPHGYHAINDLARSGNVVGAGKEPLYACVYDDFRDLEEVAKETGGKPVIGVYVPKGKISFQKFAEAIAPFDKVIHTRVGAAENAAIVAAQACYAANPKLKPSRFTFLRRKKSERNVEEFLRLWEEKGKSFEVS